MINLTIRLEKVTDALWALPEIAKKVVEGYVAGDCHGVKWWIKNE